MADLCCSHLTKIKCNPVRNASITLSITDEPMSESELGCAVTRTQPAVIDNNSIIDNNNKESCEGGERIRGAELFGALIERDPTHDTIGDSVRSV